jgi:hypothetical protein
MEGERTIKELIGSLKTLRLQEADLTAQLEKAMTRRETQREGGAAPH